MLGVTSGSAYLLGLGEATWPGIQGHHTGIEDIPWRLVHRAKWLGYSLLGPAQLEGDSDPSCGSGMSGSADMRSGRAPAALEVTGYWGE